MTAVQMRGAVQVREVTEPELAGWDRMVRRFENHRLTMVTHLNTCPVLPRGGLFYRSPPDYAGDVRACAIKNASSASVNFLLFSALFR